MCFILTISVPERIFDSVTAYLDDNEIRFVLSEQKNNALDIQVVSREQALAVQDRVRSIDEAYRHNKRWLM